MQHVANLKSLLNIVTNSGNCFQSIMYSRYIMLSSKILDKIINLSPKNSLYKVEMIVQSTYCKSSSSD